MDRKNMFSCTANLVHGCHRSGNGQGKKKFFKVREKSGNFTPSQGKFKCLRELVREKGNFKSTKMYLLPTQRCFCVNKPMQAVN